MNSKNFVYQPMAIAALALACGAAQGAITVYTSQALFDLAVANKGTDTFAGLSVNSLTNSPISRSTNVGSSYSYTASAPGNFFGAGTAGDPWLSTNTATETITFAGFTAGAQAIGGNFFGSNSAGGFLAGDITLVATDSFSVVSTQTITGATLSSFLGFVSTGTITSLKVTAVPAGPSLWPTVDNLQLAVVAVPEPGTYAMLLAGLGVLGFMVRRRTN